MQLQGLASRFQDLPEDIVRLIFEIAVEADDYRPTLALISKQIQRW
jgi:hypothetical protein